MINSSYFKIETIIVKGSKELTVEKIIRLTNFLEGDNIFTVNRKLSENNLEKDPRIKEAKIIRKFPSKIIINIVETKSIAKIKYFGSYLEIDNKKRVINVSNKNRLLPEITGLDIFDFKLGGIVNTNRETEFEKVLITLNELIKTNFYGTIKEIIIEENSNYKVKLENAIIVEVDEIEKLKEKYFVLYEILQNKEDGIVDMRGRKEPVFKPTKKE